jgi:hypothetical protein
VAGISFTALQGYAFVRSRKKYHEINASSIQCDFGRNAELFKLPWQRKGELHPQKEAPPSYGA